MSRLGSFLAVLGIGAGFVVTGGCWSATEATIRISTDLACAQSLRTVVYVGAPNAVGTTPAADTRTCTTATAAGADNEIGTLTLVPRDAKDGRVEVRAVIAQNGQDPATCADDGTDCIVQTRTFSFIEHSAQSIPIRLLQQCLGTVCPAGQTCIGPQQCSSSELTCASTDSCAVDSGTPIVQDGGGGTVTPVACEQRGRDGVLASAERVPAEQLSTYVHGGVRGIVWFDAGVRRQVAVNATPVDGTAGIPPFGMGSIAPTAFADVGDGTFVAIRPVETRKGSVIVFPTASRTQYELDAPATTVAARGNLVLVGEDRRAELVDFDRRTLQQVANFPTTRVAMTTQYLLVSDVDGTGVHRIRYGSGTADLAADTPLPFFADKGAVAFAVTQDGARGYVAGTTASVIDPIGGSAVVIASIDEPTSMRSTESAERVTSLAVDGTRPYWTHGDNQISYFAESGKIVSSRTLGDVAHLAVDESCLYYWHQLPNRAELRAVTKPK